MLGKKVQFLRVKLNINCSLYIVQSSFLSKMNNNPNYNYVELDERAFSIFLIEGIHYYLDQDPPLRRSSIIDYCMRLWNRWNDLNNEEKRPFLERAEEELRRLRRYHRADIYRELMRDDILPDDDNHRNRRRQRQN